MEVLPPLIAAWPPCFEMLDGVAYTAGRKVFASLNAKAGNWYCHEDGHYWSAMVVQDKDGEKSRRS